MEIRREELRPRTEVAPAGEVRIRKEVVEDEVTAEIPLVSEELVIERTPLEPQPSERRIGEPREFTITLRAERVVLERRPVVAEQLRVSKRAVRETASARAQARREEPVVESEGHIQVADRSRR
jgi:uncharacterized protein (TIGR02271 family)